LRSAICDTKEQKFNFGKWNVYVRYHCTIFSKDKIDGELTRYLYHQVL
jgi:hypothetical protein